MERADRHLEASLEELNDRINGLEASGDRERLLEAYVNRGAVLSMMDFRTSALDDLESASDLADELTSEGVRVDPGTYVKIHVTIGSLIFDQGGDPVEEYSLAAEHLRELGPGSMHFDNRSIARMCISVCENLLDSEHPEDCEPFLEAGMRAAEGRDQWSENRMMDLHSLAGEVYDEMNEVYRSVDEFSQAVSLGIGLMERGLLEDTDQLIFVLVMRAQGESGLGDIDASIQDLSGAVEVLESMMENSMLKDREVLVNLHHDLAGELMKAGRVEEAESHLVRAMELGIAGYVGSRADTDMGL